MEAKIFQGKDIDEAIKTACKDLEVDRDKLQVEVIDPGKRGFLGFGKKPAQVKVTLLKDLVAHFTNTTLNVDREIELDFTERDRSGAEVVTQMLEDLFKESGIVATVSYEVQGDQLVFEIESEQYKGLIIGKKGRTINSLQAIAQSIFAHHGENRFYVILDIDNYRDVRGQQITIWLNQAVEIVRRSGKSYRFSPMVAVERRLMINRLEPLNDITFRVRGSYPRKYIEISKRLAG
ncbi:Jag N-terminal domain-containing protein [Xylocopilactobacillus apicola]|uniref:RNA-binding protein KhpB n=1 Tax=Xylocopilactobacillus apicola TaxID=2932184 RepID=A0AAU9DZK5_9LACO|nr:Jag N-terminal domain-containing protein [Xylocopilactobacillus apicola]BDR59733.1 RNA-binding protein [Xylocopilactobacillus apicola]